MRIVINYRTAKGFKDDVVENGVKVEKLFVQEFEGDPIEVIRVYDTDRTWRTWVASDVIGIYIYNY